MSIIEVKSLYCVNVVKLFNSEKNVHIFQYKFSDDKQIKNLLCQFEKSFGQFCSLSNIIVLNLLQIRIRMYLFQQQYLHFHISYELSNQKYESFF